jgi:hypothetical protein
VSAAEPRKSAVMKLHQLRLDYSTEQDRLLLRISTDDGKEVLLWLTRRCVKLMWPLLLEMAQSNPRIALQSSPEARAALFGLEHEKALRGADFSRPYDEVVRERPLGHEPLLVTRLQVGRDAEGRHVLSLAPAAGQRVNVTLDDKLLHSFCRMLQRVVSDTDWDLTLELPKATVAGGERAARTIN